tara:strand:- start:191 stop:616 length:426 start_codon:yes stop_codon:yes gene_type:complete
MIKNKRREFLKNACAPVVIGILGISLLESCSKEDKGSTVLANQTSDISITINLSSEKFSSLSVVGGWYNYTLKNILLVRISELEIRAFDNSCPHQGARNLWSYNGNTFTCSNHGNKYPDSCDGGLICYKSKIEGDILIITN